MDNFTSKKDFEYYCKRVRYWIDQFGLFEFEIDFVHRFLGDEPGFLNDYTAGIRLSAAGRCATFYLNKDWGLDKISNLALNRVAIHEVGHLLLCEYYHQATNRFGVTVSGLEVTEHAIIRRLENFILRT